MMIISVAVRITLPDSTPRSRIVLDASANAIAPRNPQIHNMWTWFSGICLPGDLHAFIFFVNGKMLHALPPMHANSATIANGIDFHAWFSKNIATPMYMNTNVSASVASVLKISFVFFCDSGDRFGRV